MMNPVHNWKDILRRAWSVRLMFLAIVLSGLEMALPFIFESRPFAPGVLATVSGLLTMTAMYARFVAQKNLS